MHCINRCTWKSSQHYVIMITMASFMRVSSMFVFHWSKCISAIKRLPFYYLQVCILVFFHVLCVPCYCDACLSLMRCVREWRRYTIQFSFQTQKTGHCRVFAIILLNGKDATVLHDTFGQARSHWTFVCSFLQVSFPNFVVPRNMFFKYIIKTKTLLP